MAKKSKSKKSLNLNENSVKAILALFILLLTFGVYLIFNTYQQNILSSSFAQVFVALVIVLAFLLVCLLFLINPPKSKR